jgi:hypothetical protein
MQNQQNCNCQPSSDCSNCQTGCSNCDTTPESAS